MADNATPQTSKTTPPPTPDALVAPHADLLKPQMEILRDIENRTITSEILLKELHEGYLQAAALYVETNGAKNKLVLEATGQNSITYRIDATGALFRIDPDGEKPDGNIMDATHALAAAELMHHAQDTILEDLQNKRLIEIQRGQRMVAGLFPGAEDDVLKIAQHCEDAADLLAKLRQRLGKDESEEKILRTWSGLWDMELARRAVDHSPYFPELGDNKGFRHFAALHDAAYGMAGLPSDTMAKINPNIDKLPKPKDSFFKDESVYTDFYDRPVDASGRPQMPSIAGDRLGPEYAGRNYTRDEVSWIARQKLEARALAEGIPIHDISKAMFEGRFNPPLADVKLAYLGLGVSAGERSDCTKEWNRRYGRIEDIPDITTRTTTGLKDKLDITEVKTNGKEIMNRLAERLPTHHVDPDEYCAATYFELTDVFGERDFRRDYNKGLRDSPQGRSDGYYASHVQLPNAGLYRVDVDRAVRDALTPRPDPNAAPPPAPLAQQFIDNRDSACSPCIIPPPALVGSGAKLAQPGG